MPVLELGFSVVTMKQGQSFSIRPQTLNYLSQAQAYETNGYTFTISDVRLLNSFNGVGIDTLFGTNTALTATLQVVGRDSGARVSIPITINKVG